MTTTTERRAISIWSEDGLVGNGYVNHHGEVDCSAEIGEDAYEAIRGQIEEGRTSGRVRADRDGRIYSWQIED